MVGERRPGEALPRDPSRLDAPVRHIATVLLVVISGVVLLIVLTPGPPDPHGQEYLHRYLDRAHTQGLPSWIDFGMVEGAANVLLFIPLGLLGALSMRRRNYLVVPAAAAVSGLLELAQLALPPDRVASVHDVLANTLGALVGLLLAVPALRQRRRRRRRYLHGRRAAGDSRRQVARAART
jgi:VanZ family protein